MIELLLAKLAGDGFSFSDYPEALQHFFTYLARTDLRENILRFIDVEIPTVALARVAGEALAAVRGASTIDAIVMASAALRCDVVYTTDVADLEALRAHFPSVRVLGV